MVKKIVLHENDPNTCTVKNYYHNTGLSLLAESDTWFSDGNFGVALEFFKKLYVKRV